MSAKALWLIIVIPPDMVSRGWAPVSMSQPHIVERRPLSSFVLRLAGGGVGGRWLSNRTITSARGLDRRQTCQS